MYFETDFSPAVVAAAAARDEQDDADRRREPARHGYLTRTTVDVLRSACLKTSFTSPLFGANQLVRVPVPNL